MTVRVERTIEIDAPPDAVWDFISDPAKRANAISVVDSYEIEGDSATWHVRLPIPMVRATVSVVTRDVERREGESVQFVGSSSVFKVSGEHELEATDDGGTRLTNRFIVDGRVPGVETFFSRNLDSELDNLERALREEVT